MDVKSRLVNYYKNNQFIQKYIKGLNASTNEIVLVYGGKEKSVPIDTLEKLTDETSLINYINVTNAEVAEAQPSIQPEAQPQEEVLETTQTIETNTAQVITAEPSLESLNDIKILTELKNKEALDNILRKFAVNETTGLIDINKAIDIVETNTRNEVIESIKNNYSFDLNPSNYDVQGRLIGEKIPDAISADEKIVSSFNNVRVYLEASKMYPEQINYSEEMINKKLSEYIEKTKALLNNKPEQSKVEVSNQPVQPIPVQQENQSQPDTASAGFADIIVLSMIVIVYAIIIVNLILKLA